MMIKDTATKHDATAGTSARASVLLAVEETIALVINQRYRVNLLASPALIEELAIGYLITEGLVAGIDQVTTVVVKDGKEAWVETTSTSEDFFYWTEIRTSGCVGIKQQHESLGEIAPSDFSMTPGTLFAAQEAMRSRSEVWVASGGAHMSALIDEGGAILHFAEDVGRHNTIDKVVGLAAKARDNFSNMALVTSGRLSAAMIAKVARANIPMVVSNTAALAQGLEVARRTGVTAVGFAREPLLNVYHEGQAKLLS